MTAAGDAVLRIDVDQVGFMAGKFDFAYYCAAGLLVMAAIAMFFMRPPKQAGPAGSAKP